jgi:hypothetical protein
MVPKTVDKVRNGSKNYSLYDLLAGNYKKKRSVFKLNNYICFGTTPVLFTGNRMCY